MAGYHVTHAGEKCLSVRTNVQASGAWEFLLNVQAGPGVQRHLHGYAHVTPSGVVLSCGARLKNDVDDYIGPAVPLSSHSTEELARFTVEHSNGGTTCRFTQARDQEWLCTGPGAVGGRVTRNEISLVVTGNRAGDEYRVLFYDAGTLPRLAPDAVVLPFTGGVPFGMALEPIASSSSYSTHVS